MGILHAVSVTLLRVHDVFLLIMFFLTSLFSLTQTQESMVIRKGIESICQENLLLDLDAKIITGL